MKKNPNLFLFIILVQMININFTVASTLSNSSNDEIINEIERSLIFNKESREQIDFYKKNRKAKQDAFVIDRSIKSEEKEKNKDKKNTGSEIQISVDESKAENYEVREKEKLAYNAVLIGQYEVAIQLYKSILSTEPNNLYAKQSLASVYHKIGQLKQAKNLYYKILKDRPDNQQEISQNLLSIMIEESPHDALYILSRLSSQNPDSAFILAQAGIVNERLKNYDEAINLFEKASNIESNNINYLYNLGTLYDKTKQYEKAIDVYSSVLKISNDSSNKDISFDLIKKRIEELNQFIN
jgi:tetratricopeptide (TPR) repeat protein